MRLHELTDQHLADLASLTVLDILAGWCDAASLNDIRDEAMRREIVMREAQRTASLVRSMCGGSDWEN